MNVVDRAGALPMNELLLAIDAGTGSVRAVLFDADGRQVAIGQREYVARRASPACPARRSSTRRPTGSSSARASARRSTRAAVDASAIRAVATTSMREGMVLYDRGGQRDLGLPERRLARRAPRPPSSCESGAARGDLRARRRLGGDHRAGAASAGSPAPARRSSPAIAPRRDARRLDRDPALRRVRHRPVARLELGHVRPRRPRLVGARSSSIVGLDRAQVLPPVRRARHGGRRGHDRRRPPRPGSPRARRSSPAAPTRSSALLGIGVAQPGRCTVVGGIVLAAHGGARRAADRPAARACGRSATPSRAVDDRGHRLLLAASTMRWFRDAFCDSTTSNGRPSGRWTSTTSWPSGRPRVPPGSNGVLGIFSNVMHASRWIHASPAFVQFDISAPERVGQERVLPRDPGGRGLRRRAATAASSRRSPAPCPTRSCSRAAPRTARMWAADPRRRARRPRARAGGQGVDGPRRGDLRRARGGHLLVARRRRPAGAVRAHRRARPGRGRRPTKSCTRHGSRPTGACSSWLPTGSCARSGARPEPERPNGRTRSDARSRHPRREGLPPRRPGVDGRLLPEGLRRATTGACRTGSRASSGPRPAAP